jgi:hypothetical protein
VIIALFKALLFAFIKGDFIVKPTTQIPATAAAMRYTFFIIAVSEIA